MDYKSELKNKLYKIIGDIEEDRIGVSFSGGVDSSLLAKISKDCGKTVELFTVAFSKDRDIKIAKISARELELPLNYMKIELEELERTLKDLLANIHYRKFSSLNTAIGFYHVLEIAFTKDIKKLISANGADELFCGYNRYLGFYPKEDDIKKYMLETIRIAEFDKKQIFDMASSRFGIEYDTPLLKKELIDFALKVPVKMKINGKDDEIRKHILREVALDCGLSKKIAMMPKKAFQYSSGIQKGIKKLAKKHGYTRNSGRTKGYESPLEAYIEKLKDDLKKEGEIIVS